MGSYYVPEYQAVPPAAPGTGRDIGPSSRVSSQHYGGSRGTATTGAEPTLLDLRQLQALET